MKWSIGKKFAAGLGLAVVMILILVASAYFSMDKMLEARKWSAHTLKVQKEIDDLVALMVDAETGQRGYIITGLDRYLEPYNKATEMIDPAIEDLRQLTSDNPKQQQRIVVLKQKVAEKLGEMKETIQLRKEKGFEPALQIVLNDKGKKVMDEIRALLAEMYHQERTLLSERDKNLDAQTLFTKNVLIFGSLLALALLVFTGWVIVRSISEPLKKLNDAIDTISSSTAEIVATTTQLASNASETAASASETTTTVEEVRQTANVASQKAKYVSESAQKASEIAKVGKKAVEDTIEGMNGIKEKMESVAESIVTLSEQSQAIGEIIAAVDDLSEQSNLLAVNASIEAVKAGEQGKGFSVVAQEIKALAEQSKQATKRVRSILNDIQRATGKAVMATEEGSKTVETGARLSTQAGENIQALANAVAEASQAAVQIAASSQQQLVGMDQVAAAMESVKTASVQNAAGAKQMEATTHNLSELGSTLKDLVLRYRIAV